MTFLSVPETKLGQGLYKAAMPVDRIKRSARLLGTEGLLFHAGARRLDSVTAWYMAAVWRVDKIGEHENEFHYA